MKGPSLDAIKRFKQQQEIKKREEDERKKKEKLNTLSYRAAQGDRKAKQQLKKIEHVQPRIAPNEPPPRLPKEKVKRHVPAEIDFKELMQIAKNNANIKPGASKEAPSITKQPKPVIVRKEPPQSSQPIKQAQPSKVSRPPRPPHVPQPQVIHKRKFRPVEYDDDDYESDGFVVDDDEDDARAELSATLKSVFRYDKRKADMREEEVDRHYRAIGRVSTFEDLEREERRAARLAAAEDARAFKEEEERKRLKKLRLIKEKKKR